MRSGSLIFRRQAGGGPELLYSYHNIFGATVHIISIVVTYKVLLCKLFYFRLFFLIISRIPLTQPELSILASSTFTFQKKSQLKCNLITKPSL
jgi:hypothetical protein